MKSQEAIRNKLRTAFLIHAEGHIRKHLANVEVLLSNPAGIGEHGDIVGEIEKELKEGREVTEKEKIRVYIDNINEKFRDKRK